MPNKTTLIIPVAPEFSDIREDSDSVGGPFFDARFTAHPDYVVDGAIAIAVQGKNKARFLAKCQTVLEAGSIRATGYFDFDQNSQHLFVADSFRAAKQRLD